MPTDGDPINLPTVGAATTQSDLVRTLDVIAEGIREVSGFNIVMFGVVRNPREVECIHVLGGTEALRRTVGTMVSIAKTRAYAEAGPRLGAFTLSQTPGLRLLPENGTPHQPAGHTDDELWPAGQLMVASLRSAEGREIGYLGVADPRDATKPNAEQLAHLDTFAEQAARVLSRALSVDSMEQRFELIGKLREIIHKATVEVGAFALIQEIAPQIMEVFNATDFAVQLYDEPGNPEVAPPIRRMDGSLGAPSPFFWRLAIDATFEAFERNWVSVVTGSNPAASFMSPEHHAGVLAHLHSEGMSSAIQAPLIVGTEFVGSLFLGRAEGDWTHEQEAAAAAIGHDVGRAVINARAREHDQQAMARLRELDSFKTHLITQISHEFRSPLTTIMGHLELTEDAEGQMAPPSMSAMRRGTQRLLKLTEQLMTLSAMADSDNGRESCNAVEVVRDAVTLYADQAERKGLAISTSVPHTPVTIDSSAYEFELLVVNLIDNAIKYTDAGGTVEVSLGVVGRKARLAVRDTGIGVPPEHHRRLFDEFFRSDQSAAVRRPGTGLGLSIVARIVERLEGEIDVESAPGEGATFSVALPLGTPQAEAEHADQVC